MVSILNGLSALGTSTAAYAASAGLEAQKADLAKQNLMLADQLSTNRALNVDQPFQASQLATTEAGANSRSAANNQTSLQVADKSAASAATVAGIQGANELQRQQMVNSADTPEIKLLRLFHLAPDSPPTYTPAGQIANGAQSGGSSAPAGTINSTPSGSNGASSGGASSGGSNGTGGAGSSSSGTGSTGSSSTDWGSASPGAPSTSSATPDPSVTGTAGSTSTGNGQGGGMMDKATGAALIQKALGLPGPGSEQALRAGLAADVAADPQFANASAGAKAAETEMRVAVASGKMIDPVSRNTMALGIASYQIAPLSSNSAGKEGAAETMAQVLKLNPQYQASFFPVVSKTMQDFATGEQGNVVRSNNVAVQHLALFDQAAQALQNGDVGALNSLKQAWARQFNGSPVPTNFDGLKQVVTTEVERATSGSVGAVGDRQAIADSLSRANSPQQLMQMTNSFRALMVGQLAGLKTQYEDGTHFRDPNSQFAFENKLDPPTREALKNFGPNGTMSFQPPAYAAGGSAPADPNAPMTGQQMYGGSTPAAPPPAGAKPGTITKLWGN